MMEMSSDSESDQSDYERDEGNVQIDADIDDLVEYRDLLQSIEVRGRSYQYYHYHFIA
jgi:hypothetical protein